MPQLAGDAVKQNHAAMAGLLHRLNGLLQLEEAGTLASKLSAAEVILLYYSQANEDTYDVLLLNCRNAI